MQLNLEGHEVTTISFAYAVDIGTLEESVIRLNDSFEWVEPDGTSHRVADNLHTADSASSLVKLIGQHVVASTADDSGGLHLTFSGGGQLRAPAADGWESWQVRNSKAPTLIISTPGGELVIWDND